jgi:hypothetical protein
MSQWGKYANSAANSVLWGVSSTTKKRATAANRNVFFENTTPDAVITGMTLGQFGVEPSQMAVYNGPINQVTITYPGSGYQNSPAFSIITGGGGSGANVSFPNSAGRVNGYTINNGGTSYETAPTITINAPEVNLFNGNTGISGGGIIFTAANSHWVVGDRLTYAGNVTSTPVGLTNNTRYFIQAVNTTTISLSATLSGPKINLLPASGDMTTANNATIQGDTATAVAVVGGALHKGVTHAGWVVRKVGSGGRAGRVSYETLVAARTLIGNIDAVANTVLPSQNT